jgi:hypothetical protein
VIARRRVLASSETRDLRQVIEVHVAREKVELVLVMRSVLPDETVDGPGTRV